MNENKLRFDGQVAVVTGAGTGWAGSTRACWPHAVPGSW
jgi:hypothetical protein